MDVLRKAKLDKVCLYFLTNGFLISAYIPLIVIGG